MNLPKQTLPMALMVLLLLAAGGGIGWWLALHNQPSVEQATENHAVAETPESSRKVLYWYDPMQPQQHFDKPGPSPFMDMPLIPKYAEDAGEESVAGLSIDAAISQNIGMRLAEVARIPLSHRIEATGLIAFNEREVAVVQTRSGGFVERASPLAVGDVVKAGQPLVEMLVPEWAAAQHELLAVRDFADGALLNAARERLRLLGMPEYSIQQLERTGSVQNRYTVSAPVAGVIQDLEVRNGMTLMSGQTVVRINGLASVWLEVAVPEAQAASVRIGDSAQVRLTAFPGHDIEGRIAEILPMLKDSSRSIRVRIELKNPQQQLRPGLSAQVTLNSADMDSALAVPTEAVIRTGKRNLVMLAGESGRFMPQEVVLGAEIGNQTIVNAGLEEGQQVVASGQFLLDSEASLNGLVARPVEAEPIPNEHPGGHEGHDMTPAPTPTMEHQHHMGGEQ
ncbi:MAG: efflux RND transporter periplasmic adaptor subunit [Methylococcaceae bacterium]|nr:efflux RND transporter periplasmic adaptor subunit [Methylococcaceae bacterium]